MADKLKTITVMATGNDGKVKLGEGKVVLWDKHPDHPEDGEAFVVNDGIPREVAETAAVKRGIAEGRLTTDVNWDSKAAKTKLARKNESTATTEETDDEDTEPGKKVNLFGTGKPVNVTPKK
jgi:hypothetical protein